MDRKNNALSCFDKGFNCCQSVLTAFSDDFSLDNETAMKIASGFGGGMRKGETCGAVTGALMVLGLKYGYFIEGDLDSKNRSNAIALDFQNRFIDINQTVICKELLGYDLSTVDGMSKLKEIGAFSKFCPKYIEDCVGILQKMIGDLDENN